MPPARSPGPSTSSTHGEGRVLVDCGLFQGLKELRLRNWDDFPFPPASIDAVVLTHAHLDHVGYLPRLVARASRPRLLHARHAGAVPARAARLRADPGRGRAAGQPARLHASTIRRCRSTREPTRYRALTQLQPVGYDRPIEVVPRRHGRVSSGRPLLGSAYVVVRLSGGTTILFGGDLGRYDRPVLPDPAMPVAADVVLVESTYGDRDHPPDDEGDGWRRSSVTRRRAAARWSSRRLRSAASRRCSTGSAAREASSAFRCCRSTSTARWRPRRCSSTPQRVARARSRHAADRSGQPCRRSPRAVPDRRLAAAVEGADRQPPSRPS